jgi:hypothetical protein
MTTANRSADREPTASHGEVHEHLDGKTAAVPARIVGADTHAGRLGTG